MNDRATLIVYLPRETRERIQRIADEEGISASAVARRVLVPAFKTKAIRERRRGRGRRDLS